MRRQQRTLARTIVIISAAVALGACSSAASETLSKGEIPASRAWIVNTETYVKADKPTPPGAARLYAYVAKAYADTRAHGSVAEANEVTRRVATAVMPTHVADIDAFASTIAKPVTTLPRPSQQIVDALVERSKADNWQADNNDAAMASAPKGPGYWVKVTKAGPFAPSAGTWTRWILPSDATFDVPPPPTFGSPAFETQLQEVADAARKRDAEWVNAINYWGGVPGTEGPSGIWLNQLWKRVSADPLARDDRSYARVQSVLAQTLADAFMECWKVKYSYWTARPDMTDPMIKTAMPDPPFPGYVSGHSTISAAAATVLAKLTPTHADEFRNDALQARDSRLYAGIHFPVDNEQGFSLGTNVGNAVLAQTKNGTRT